jgi:hypothetical protein
VDPSVNLVVEYLIHPLTRVELTSSPITTSRIACNFHYFRVSRLQFTMRPSTKSVKDSRERGQAIAAYDLRTARERMADWRKRMK